MTGLVGEKARGSLVKVWSSKESWSVSWLGFLEFPGSLVQCVLLFLENFKPSYLQIFILTHFSLSYFWDSITRVLECFTALRLLDVLFFFFWLLLFTCFCVPFWVILLTYQILWFPSSAIQLTNNLTEESLHMFCHIFLYL